MRLFNEKDRKNILISFAAAILFFAAVFFTSSVFDLEVKDLLTLGGKSSEAVNFFSGEKKQDSTVEEIPQEKIKSIEIDLNAEKLNIAISDEEDIIVTSEKPDHPEQVDIFCDFGNYRILSDPEKKISSEVTVSIPEKFITENSVDISINCNDGSITFGRVIDGSDDDLSIQSRYGYITVAGLTFRSIDLYSKAGPIMVDSCSSEVISCKSDQNEIFIEGSFDEIQLESYLGIISDFKSKFNRLDAQSAVGDISLGLRKTEGFTLRLTNCHGNIKSTYETTISSKSTKGSIFYEYLDGSSKIHIKDTQGDISLY